MGAAYIFQDIFVDGDLVTGLSAGHCAPLSMKIIDMLAEGSFTG